ncbi:unnamed protein product [Nippostrongylus brasiliensis]|uniref:Transposase n=1 Tax=Nippostrongylus brasiliensis TaxID=27835 RepID=A0A0N4XCW7_NIPBR|nr:unnamed protein product [Nippostrongylus brasiliensis]
MEKAPNGDRPLNGGLIPTRSKGADLIGNGLAPAVSWIIMTAAPMGNDLIRYRSRPSHHPNPIGYDGATGRYSGGSMPPMFRLGQMMVFTSQMGWLERFLPIFGLAPVFYSLPNPRTPGESMAHILT